MTDINTDFYKVDHRSQYPKGTELVFSNWTPRKSRMPNVNSVVFLGLQAALHKMLESWDENFFSVYKDVAIERYKHRISNAGIEIDYKHMEDLHDLQYLPIEVWSLPEGVNVPIGVPMFVMWNTDPRFFWVTNYLETSLSANLWPYCTSATIAREYRHILNRAALKSGGDLGFVDWQAHDFSYRGMMGDEAAAMTGTGHLLYFNGTDTIPAIESVCEVYRARASEVGGSVPATEHSVMCMGTKENEIETYRRLITEVYPKGIVSIVSDTWDYWKVWTEILPALKDEIMARDGKVVIRPDSGDPVKILTGDINAPAGSPARLGSFQLAWDLFGGTITSEGYKQLDSHIGLIYGDSITLDRAERICDNLLRDRFVPNMVLGVGSYTYQMVTRDTFGFALKSTAGIVNGEVREIFKDPVTDDGTKKSAKGFVAVYKNENGYYLHEVPSLDQVKNCEFVKRLSNDEIHNTQRFADMRKLAR